VCVPSSKLPVATCRSAKSADCVFPGEDRLPSEATSDRVPDSLSVKWCLRTACFLVHVDVGWSRLWERNRCSKGVIGELRLKTRPFWFVTARREPIIDSIMFPCCYRCPARRLRWFDANMSVTGRRGSPTRRDTSRTWFTETCVSKVSAFSLNTLGVTCFQMVCVHSTVICIATWTMS